MYAVGHVLGFLLQLDGAASRVRQGLGFAHYEFWTGFCKCQMRGDEGFIMSELNKGLSAVGCWWNAGPKG